MQLQKDTKYDYLHGNKNILSANGRSADVILLFKDTFKEMGDKGFLKGAAQDDYKNGSRIADLTRGF